MNSQLDRLRTNLRVVLKTTGLLGLGRRLRVRFKDLSKFLRDPEFRRRKREERQRFQQFKKQYGNVLKQSLSSNNGQQKRVLIVSRHFTALELQLGLLKALELAGFLPMVLTVSRRRQLRNCYRWAGVKTVIDWSKLVDHLDFSGAAQAVIEECGSVEELLEFEYDGTRSGKIAVSTTLRQLHTGTLDLQSPQVRQILISQLASAMASATAAQTILQQLRPQLMLSFDVEYTPGGQLFDKCMESGVEVVTYREGHKRDTLILKRYSPQNRDQNPVSLSEESWEAVKSMEWSIVFRNELREELYNSYASGDWYNSGGTQSTTRLMDANAIRKQLGLSPEKKTAFIFPHIPWDASLRWGKDLFRGYEEWLIETVRAACTNEQVNWVIKIHPANVRKQPKGQLQSESAEVLALNKHFRNLPRNVFLMPAESEISTFSLFELMDYCLTVRGTVGIEAASLGIPALTAGTGRYDHMGFTIDSETREEYLEKVANVQEIPRLSARQRELAERFAYAIFLLRPFPLESVSVGLRQNAGVTANLTHTAININATEEWYSAPDLKAFAQWLNESSNADFLVPLPR